MFVLSAKNNQLAVAHRELLTSGSVNVYTARFEFSADWDGLERVAVFRSGAESRSVVLRDDGECVIPWEVLDIPRRQLMVGIYGTRGVDVVLPTVWASLGTIQEGAAPGENARPPTPDLWQQALAGKGDRLDYTPDGDLALYAQDKLLSAVPVSGGGSGGVTDHRLLSHRDAERQHPIQAIDGLPEELERIPAPVEPLTNEELEVMLK